MENINESIIIQDWDRIDENFECMFEKEVDDNGKVISYIVTINELNTDNDPCVFVGFYDIDSETGKAYREVDGRFYFRRMFFERPHNDPIYEKLTVAHMYCCDCYFDEDGTMNRQ